MNRLPTKFEIEHYKKDNSDIKILGGVCVVIIVIAAGLLLIG
ncbi:hypothetical protein [Megamonas hypermegale]|nr:hypothetical protein [Megamonas hypermegale]